MTDAPPHHALLRRRDRDSVWRSVGMRRGLMVLGLGPGLVALVEAAGSFEDRGQVTFKQYLTTRLRGAMIDELRRHAAMTRGAIKRRRDYNRAVQALRVPPASARCRGSGGPVRRARTARSAS